MAIATVNPATGETLREFAALDDAEIDRCIDQAHQTFLDLRATTFATRAGWLRAAADILDDDADDIARMMTTEMGKTLVSARAEVHKCAKAARFYAEHAESFLADVPADPAAVSASAAYTRWQPLGPVLAVMPWNFPLWQVMRFAAPALMAGNVGLLKHASNVPQCALAIEEVFREAGFPEGCFQTLLIGGERVKKIVEDPRVAAATLTGSDGAGRSIATAAGAQLKKTVLELGGSDPFVVLPSADLDKAAQVAVTARVQNAGQSCIAAKRFIVHEKIAPEFEKRFVQGMRALKIGDPQDDATDIGPLASKQVLEDVEKQVRGAREQGANLACGGRRVDRPGFFFEPTIIAENRQGSEIIQSEVFGPVVVVCRFSTEEEVLQKANNVIYGLAASVWTKDIFKAMRASSALQFGTVWINDHLPITSEMPHGGYKQSGIGKDMSIYSFEEYTQIKHVLVELTGEARKPWHYTIFGDA